MRETRNDDLVDFYEEQQDIKDEFLNKLIEIVIEIKSLESKDILTDKQKKKLVELRHELNNHIFQNI